MKKIIRILCILLLTPSLSFAFSAKVIGVYDGDTITVLTAEKQEIKIRLYGVDAPEKSQAFGQKAKKFTSDLVFGKTVDVRQTGGITYKRSVSIISIENKILNEELLKYGFAWFSGQYCKLPTCSKWRDLESSAKTSKIGLWADENPTPPWDFRRGENNKDISEEPTTINNQGILHGNANSKIFHKADCKNFNCKNCTVQFSSREEALTAMYMPCKGCNP